MFGYVRVVLGQIQFVGYFFSLPLLLGNDDIADIVVIGVHLGWRAEQLLDIEIGTHQVQMESVEGLPGLRIHYGIDDRQRELQIVVIHAVKAFLDPQIFAMRPAGMVYPAFWIEPEGFDDEGVVILPPATWRQ